MQAHAVANVLTLDTTDFARYQDAVSVWTPEQVVREHRKRFDHRHARDVPPKRDDAGRA